MANMQGSMQGSMVGSMTESMAAVGRSEEGFDGERLGGRVPNPAMAMAMLGPLVPKMRELGEGLWSEALRRARDSMGWGGTRIEQPRISVTKLGQYLTAKPRRRWTILRQSKFRKPEIVDWHGASRLAITECLLAGGDPHVLRAAVARLQEEGNKAPEGDRVRVRAKIAIEDLEAFASKHLDQLGIEEALPLRGEVYQRELEIGGVRVVLRPDLIFKSDRGVGAMLLYLNKHTRLDEVGGAYMAAMLQLYIERELPGLGAVDRSACKVVDVIGGSVRSAPRYYKRRRGDIEAACREIGAIWPGLTESS